MLLPVWASKIHFFSSYFRLKIRESGSNLFSCSLETELAYAIIYTSADCHLSDSEPGETRKEGTKMKSYFEK